MESERAAGDYNDSNSSGAHEWGERQTPLQEIDRGENWGKLTLPATHVEPGHSAGGMRPWTDWSDELKVFDVNTCQEITNRWLNYQAQFSEGLEDLGCKTEPRTTRVEG